MSERTRVETRDLVTPASSVLAHQRYVKRRLRSDNATPESGSSGVANTSYSTPALNDRTRVMFPAPSMPTEPLLNVESLALKSCL